MSNFKKIFLISSIFLTIAVLIIGYKYYNSNFMNGSNPNSNAITSDTVVLDYYIWSDEKSYIEPVISAYCALYTNVTINLHVIDPLTYEKEIQTLLSSDTKIDLLGVKGISQLVQVHNQGQLLDLTSYIKKDDMEVTAYGSMFNDIAVDGRYYGIPTRSTCWFLLYNKDLFDQADIDYPEQMTWEEYRKLSIALTKGEGNDKIYGGYWVPWCYNFAALQQSSYLIDDDLTYTRESLELLNKFYNEDKSHFAYSTVIGQDTRYRTEFEKGSIAMMPQGEWIINMLLEDHLKGLTDVNWDIAPMPVFEGQDPGITWGQYQFVSIATDTDYPKEAFNFVQFLCGEEGARIYAQNGIIHAYSNEEIKQIYLNSVGKTSASIFFETKRVQEQLALPGYEEVTEAFKQCAKQYLLGDSTIDEAMASFEKMRNEILNP